MKNQQLTPCISLQNIQFKDNTTPTQLQNIFHFLQEHCATVSMVSDATGIPQRNICRIKKDLEQSGLLWELENKQCEKTGFRAYYLTTNPDRVSNSDIKMNKP